MDSLESILIISISYFMASMVIKGEQEHFYPCDNPKSILV